MALVDERLELTVLYAVGDATGVAAGEIKVGVSTRAAYASELKTMRKYRAAEVVPRFEAIISGRGRAEQFKTAILAALGDKGLAFNSWRRATDAELAAIVGKLAATYGVKLLTADEAVAFEHDTYDAIAATQIGG